MSLPNSTFMNITTAQKILKSFDRITDHPTEEIPNKMLIRTALLLLTSQSDYQIFGICANTIEEGLLALTAYTKFLGYEVNQKIPHIPGPIYLKFNPKTGLCYAESYLGNHRGVLVSCQSSRDEGIRDMYGHLPLDLFSEEPSRGN